MSRFFSLSGFPSAKARSSRTRVLAQATEGGKRSNALSHYYKYIFLISNLKLNCNKFFLQACSNCVHVEEYLGYHTGMCILFC